MNEQQGFDVEDLSIGMSATYGKTVTDADIVLFAGVSGDNNAVHTNQEFAATTAFGSRIAHGMLSASFISAAIGTRMPGPGTIYLGQQLNFRAPVRPGETVNATVTVKSIDLKRSRVILDTVCHVGSTVVIDGEAIVMVTSSTRRMAKANPIPVATVAPSIGHDSPP
jgi:3-hydroxybutyryl-CoA dehydratase